MDQSFAGKYGNLPKTQSLENTIVRAIALAGEHSHRVVTLEHLLFALLDDADAASILSACDIDLINLRNSVAEYLTHGLASLRSSSAAEPFLSNDVEMVIANAGAAAEQTRRSEINGAIVLAAIVGGTSTAAQILTNNGLTFDEAINSVRTRQGQETGAVTGGAIDDESYGNIARSTQDSAPTTTSAQPTYSEPPYGSPQGTHGSGATEQGLTVDDLMASVKEIIGASTKNIPAPIPEASPEPAKQTPYPGAPASPPAPSPYTAPPGGTPPFESENHGSAPDLFADQALERRQAVPKPVGGVVSPAPTQEEAGSFDFDADARYGAAKELSRPGSMTVGQSAPAPIPQTQAGAAPASPGTPMRREASSRLEHALNSGALVENIPRNMRVGEAMPVEVRISNADVIDLDRGMEGVSTLHSVLVSEAMTVQLRAPQGGFIIESAAPETQWIGKGPTGHGQAYGNWGWTVTPTVRGRKRLQLVLSARLVDDRGLMAEAAMPEQIIVVNVKVNYVQTVKKVATWAAVAVAGGILSHYGETVIRWING